MAPIISAERLMGVLKKIDLRSNSCVHVIQHTLCPQVLKAMDGELDGIH